MNNYLKNGIAIGTLLLLVTPLSAALAREGGSREGGTESGREESSHVENESDDQDNSSDQEDGVADTEDDDSSEQELEDQDSDDDGINDHTEDLLHASDLDDDISDDLKTLAAEQQVSADIISQTIAETKDDSKLKKLMVGEDIKKINIIKEEIKNTDQRIEKIQSLADQSKNPEVKQVLEDQAKSLETDTSDLDEFVQKRENMFSFFGWLVRLFSKN